MLKMKEIKYIGFYEQKNSKSDRVCSPAATNKMNYICSAMNGAGYSVKIISPSWMGNNSKVKWEKHYEHKIDNKTKVVFCPSFKSCGKITTYAKIILSLFWLFLYLLTNTKRNEKVLVYHVPWISLPIRLAKFFINFKLVLEVEEVYSDVMIVNRIFTKWERKLINAADSYLLSTDLLKDKLNIKKPNIIIYGVYSSIEQLVPPICDGKIHLLYAGIIDSNKKGAFNALEASKYLSEKYVMHIIGFGDIDKLCNRIQELNYSNTCKVVFDGTLYDDEYIKYCQSCHIGLSTQVMEGDYLSSSFPGKVISYLSMGLHVVSCNILCVKKSSIGNIITFYQEDSPEAIAEAIQTINFTEQYNSSDIIKQLDMLFVESMKQMLEYN